ncbi:MAG: hypothetical protein VB141_07225, partial [Burkholderia gladioli]
SKMMDTTLASIFAGVYDGHAESLTLARTRRPPFASENRSSPVLLLVARTRSGCPVTRVAESILVAGKARAARG